MLITSGPIVPEMASSKLVLPLSRFLSSYFVLIRCIRRGCFVCLTPQRCTAVQRNQAYTSLKREPPRRVHRIEDLAANARQQGVGSARRERRVLESSL